MAPFCGFPLVLHICTVVIAPATRDIVHASASQPSLSRPSNASCNASHSPKMFNKKLQEGFSACISKWLIFLWFLFFGGCCRHCCVVCSVRVEMIGRSCTFLFLNKVTPRPVSSGRVTKFSPDGCCCSDLSLESSRQAASACLLRTISGLKC